MIDTHDAISLYLVIVIIGTINNDIIETSEDLVIVFESPYNPTIFPNNAFTYNTIKKLVIAAIIPRL